jgi:hypothetical protein
MTIKEGKQAEFLLFDDCPWQLISRLASSRKWRNKSRPFLSNLGIKLV